jgi:hypothetical protein
MRLWSLHPSLLGTRYLVAVWREGLLAKKVLEGNTKGYKNHSQLVRFKNTNNPIAYIHSYLWDISNYANSVMEYNFNQGKLDTQYQHTGSITVTTEQIRYEFKHLYFKQNGLEVSLPDCFMPVVHPLFVIVPGNIEHWEKVKV